MFSLLGFLIVLTLGAPPAGPSSAAVSTAVAQVLTDQGTEGAFLLYDEQQHRYYRYNEARTRSPMIPASTFKILNSLIALEEGLVADENQPIAWDGVKRFYAPWNQDQTLASAMRFSAVWVYQQFARSVGRETMQYYLDTVGYGNGAIGDKVDEFWLNGPLRISAEQQIELLRRLRSGALPFSERNLEIVRRIMIRDQTADLALRGKSGWSMTDDPDTGWFVGYLERGAEAWFFALNVDMHDNGAGRDRVGMTQDILKRLGLLVDPEAVER